MKTLIKVEVLAELMASRVKTLDKVGNMDAVSVELYRKMFQYRIEDGKIDCEDIDLIQRIDNEYKFAHHTVVRVGDADYDDILELASSFRLFEDFSEMENCHGYYCIEAVATDENGNACFLCRQ